jgi:hypothetical protein
MLSSQKTLGLAEQPDPIIFPHCSSLIIVSPLYEACNYYFFGKLEVLGIYMTSKEAFVFVLKRFGSGCQARLSSF